MVDACKICVYRDRDKMTVHGAPPTEDTLVGAGQTGCSLHAAVALDAIEGVFVTSTSTSQHGLQITPSIHGDQ